MDKKEPVVENNSIPSEAQPDGRIGEPEYACDLVGALEHLEPGKPLILNDGFFITDSGYLVFSQYVDIGVTKLRRRPSVLVKAIEAEYGLEHAPTIQVSSPHRFHDYGETFIQDDQEGRARRENKTERSPRSYEESTREQERALGLLGQKGVTISETDDPDVYKESESLTFGRSSWIYCTSILLAPSERQAWRASLPRKYNHESMIRQPAKFAMALGAMFADQTGLQERQGHFTHNNGIRSFHRSQLIHHGPVWYTDDVLGFLKAFESDPLYTMYSLFVKDSQFKLQREYRFVLHCETPTESEILHLYISGTMRDALAPPRATSPVDFRGPKDTDGGSPSQTVVATTRGNKMTTRTRSNSNRRRRTFKVGDQIADEESIEREEVVTLTTVAPADSVEEGAEAGDSAAPGVVEITQKESRKRWIEGEQVESVTMSCTRVYSIADTSGADEDFSVEYRDHAASLLKVVGRPFEGFSDLPPQVVGALKPLARMAQDLEPDVEVQVMSACWNGVWAICNLYECFGDVVASVGIEQNEFVAIELKESELSGAEGKILVGPRGTFAYVLTCGDEQRPGYGGTKTRLFFFPDDETRTTFEEFGWSPLRKAQSSGEESPEE